MRIASGTVRFNGEDITGHQAHELVERGVGFVPQSKNVFPSLTVRENLEMGCYLKPKMFDERFESSTEMFPQAAAASRDQRAGVAVGRRAADGRDGTRADARPDGAAARRAIAGLSPMLQDEVFIQCRRINASGVAILMVEQNARRCLQVCDRGYVLDQGRNAYTGTGRELLADPNVIELYLGTLSRATGGAAPPTSAPGALTH